jgi:hypothetical protein
MITETTTGTAAGFGRRTVTPTFVMATIITTTDVGPTRLDPVRLETEPYVAVSGSATRIDRGELASGPIPTPTMIAFAGDDEPSANSYSASAAAALLSAINRFFWQRPEWRIKRRTNVEDTEDSV